MDIIENDFVKKLLQTIGKKFYKLKNTIALTNNNQQLRYEI